MAVSPWGLAALVFLALAEAADARPDAGVDGAADRSPVDARLTPDGVSRVVKDHLGHVKACYERALRDEPKLAGRLDVRWTIGVNGKVTAAEVEADSLHAPTVTACVMGQIAGWTFPTPEASVDVSFPFVFQTDATPVPSASPTPSGTPAPSARPTPGGTPAPSAPPAMRAQPPRKAALGPQDPAEARAWKVARAWLLALAGADPQAMAKQTSFPLTFQPLGLKRSCVRAAHDAAELAAWVACLTKARSPILSELAAAGEEDLMWQARPDPKLVALGKGLPKGQWTQAYVNGDGVTFLFRLLVVDGDDGQPRVAAFLVRASFDQG